MAAPLPPGVTQAEVDEIYTRLVNEAIDAGTRYAVQITPHPFVRMMAVTLGTYPPPVPNFAPGSDNSEWLEIYNWVMGQRATYVDQYIRNRWPMYLLGNLADELANNPPQIPGTSQAIAWQNKVNQSGGAVSNSRLQAIDTLIAGLSANGILPLLDRLWIFAGENQAQALVDLIGANQATLVNSPVFIANKGFKFDGATTYIDTNFVMSAAGNKYTLNNAGFGVWMYVASTNSGMDAGGEGTSFNRLITRNIGQTDIAINAIGGATHRANTNNVGMFHGQRTSASATDMYLNGTVLGATESNASSVINSGDFWFGRAYVGGTWTNGGQSAGWVGASMTAAQVAAFYQTLQSFFNTIVPTSNSETAAWIAKVTNAGAQVSPRRQAAIDTLVTSLKSAGVWTGLDRLWIHA